MSVVNARIETEGALVTPHRGCTVVNNVRKTTVEYLEQLVPLSGVVMTCQVATYSNSIMIDVLERCINVLNSVLCISV